MAADGQRFLITRGLRELPPSPITVVINWPASLRNNRGPHFALAARVRRFVEPLNARRKGRTRARGDPWRETTVGQERRERPLNLGDEFRRAPCPPARVTRCLQHRHADRD